MFDMTDMRGISRRVKFYEWHKNHNCINKINSTRKLNVKNLIVDDVWYNILSITRTLRDPKNAKKRVFYAKIRLSRCSNNEIRLSMDNVWRTGTMFDVRENSIYAEFNVLETSPSIILYRFWTSFTFDTQTETLSNPDTVNPHFTRSPSHTSAKCQTTPTDGALIVRTNDVVKQFLSHPIL